MSNNNNVVDSFIADKLNKFGIAIKQGIGMEDALKNLEETITQTRDVKRVQVRFHYPSSIIRIGKLSVSRDILNSDCSGFIENNGSVSSVVCFPSFRKGLHALNQKIRWTKDKLSLGDSEYMDRETYINKFLPAYKGVVAELDALKNQLFIEYEDLVEDYREGVESLCNQIVLSDEDYRRIQKSLSRIVNRDKVDFFSSIYLELLSDFDAEGVPEGDLKDIAVSAQKMRTAALLEELIFGSFSDSFESVCSFYKNVSNVKKEDLSDCDKIKSRVSERARIVTHSNVGNSDLLNKVVNCLNELIKENDKGEAINSSYQLLADMVGVADELGFSLKTSSLPQGMDVEDLLLEYADRKAYGECFF